MAGKTLIFTLFFLASNVVNEMVMAMHVVDKTRFVHHRLLRGLQEQNSTNDESIPKKRECELTVESDDDTSFNNNEVEFQCKKKTDMANGDEVEDKIKFKVKTDDRGLVVKVEYEQEVETVDANNTETETETETQYEILFDRLVEYAKGENSKFNDAYDWESDVIVSDIPLVWGDISEVSNDENGILSTFHVKTTDGVITLYFTISRADLSASITSNSMKIDVEITGYNWLQNNTYVALISQVESTKEVEVEYDGDKSKSEAMDVRIPFTTATEKTGMTPFGEFTWATSAVVSSGNLTSTNITTQGPSQEDGGNVTVSQAEAVPGKTIQVVATSPSESDGMLAFSFVGTDAHSASMIYWDPEAGVGFASGSYRLVLSKVAIAAMSALMAFAFF